MPAVKFCSECGEQLTYKRAGFVPIRLFCRRCAPRFKTARLILLASAVLCAAIGFAVGRYTSTREPFYLIGTPVEVTTSQFEPGAGGASRSPSEGEITKRSEQLVIAPGVGGGMCGAPTRSGKSCQRRVKDGGYCWQHRDKFGEKKSPPPVR